MLALTRKTDYALVALNDLASQAPQRSSARQIAARCQIPHPMLMNILKELMNAGLVSSTRGTKGGYCLAKPPHQMTLAELIAAVEGPVKLTACCPGPAAQDDPPCHLEQSCPTKEPMQKVNVMFLEFLSQVTLADILTDQVPVTLGTPKTALQPCDAPGVTVEKVAV